jgi:Flp pilus assembly protein TadG
MPSPARSRHRLRNQSGAAPAFAVLAPVLFLLVMLPVQFALWQHAEQVVEAAAQEGVAAARVQDGSEAAGSSRAGAVLEQLGRSVVSDPSVRSVRTATVARVEVTGTAISVLPWPHFAVHGLAEAPVEVVQPVPPGGTVR